MFYNDTSILFVEHSGFDDDAGNTVGVFKEKRRIRHKDTSL